MTPARKATSHRVSPEKLFLARKGDPRFWTYEVNSPKQGPGLCFPLLLCLGLTKKSEALKG